MWLRSTLTYITRAWFLYATRPRLANIRRMVMRTCGDSVPQDEDLLSTALSTVDALDSAGVRMALQPGLPDEMRADSNAIIRVSDASFALRHFKSSRAKYPSAILEQYSLNTGEVLQQAEKLLLQIHNLHETQAQLAGIAPEKFNDLGAHVRPAARSNGLACVMMEYTMKRLKSPPKTIRSVQQALQRHCKVCVDIARATEEVIELMENPPARSNRDKVIASMNARRDRLIRQHDRAAQLLLDALRPLPKEERINAMRKSVQVALDHSRKRHTERRDQ